MKKLEVAAVCNYIYNNRSRLEHEVRELQSNLRYRQIDVVDCIKTACSIERLNTFKQPTKDILTLLNLIELNELYTTEDEGTPPRGVPRPKKKG